MDRLPKIGVPILIGIVLLIFVIAQSTVTIGSGEAGVLYKRFDGGVVTGEQALGGGMHIIAPWNKVFIYETRRRELSEKMNVLSSNGLDIKLDATAWYMPDVKNLGQLHQEIGEDYVQRILLPTLRSAARSVVGRYTPEQLYSTKRDAIQAEIYDETKKIISDQYIILDEILVRDVTLPSTIKEAIERKLKQEQESLEYEFRLVSAKKEAQRQRIEAQGKSDANVILSQSLNEKILKDKGIEATLKLSQSPNAKVVVIGSGDDGMPLILGGDN